MSDYKPKYRDLTESEIEKVSASNGLAKDIVREHFIYHLLAKKVFVTRGGLFALMADRFKDSPYEMNVIALTPDEYSVMAPMVGENPNRVIMKCVIVIKDENGNEKIKVTEYGTGASNNINYLMAGYHVELACTRASNRALRVVTQCSYTSSDEVSDESEAGTEAKNTVTEKPKATAEQDKSDKSAKRELTKKEYQKRLDGFHDELDKKLEDGFITLEIVSNRITDYYEKENVSDLSYYAIGQLWRNIEAIEDILIIADRNTWIADKTKMSTMSHNELVDYKVELERLEKARVKV